MKFKKTTLNEVCDFVGGSQPPKKTFSSICLDGYIRLIQTRDYKTDNFLTHIPEKSTNKFCNEKDIMIGRYGPPIFQILRGLKGAYNVALMKAIPKESIRNEYLYYFLKQDSLFQYIDGLSLRTGGQTGVDITMLKQYPILLPDKDYQLKVENVLGALDAKIELNNKINTELEGMAKLIYDYWFVQFDFPISAEQAAKMGKPELKGKPYKSSGGKIVYIEELKRKIPEGWEAGTLDDFGEIIGGSTPSKAEEKNFSNDGTPWITPKDLSINSGKKYIARGEIDVSDIGLKSASLKVMPAGTVLMSSRAPIGYLAIARENVTTNQGFKSFVPNKGYSTEYLYHTLGRAMPLIEANASGSTFREVSTGVLRNLIWSKSSVDFVKRYTQVISPLFQKQDILERENQQLASLRDWLLPMLMNGQVTIKEAENAIEQTQENLSMAAEGRGEYGIHK